MSRTRWITGNVNDEWHRGRQCTPWREHSIIPWDKENEYYDIAGDDPIQFPFDEGMELVEFEQFVWRVYSWRYIFLVRYEAEFFSLHASGFGICYPFGTPAAYANKIATSAEYRLGSGFRQKSGYIIEDNVTSPELESGDNLIVDINGDGVTHPWTYSMNVILNGSHQYIRPGSDGPVVSDEPQKFRPRAQFGIVVADPDVNGLTLNVNLVGRRANAGSIHGVGTMNTPFRTRHCDIGISATGYVGEVTFQLASFTIEPYEFWAYAKEDGTEPIYDSGSGEKILITTAPPEGGVGVQVDDAAEPNYFVK